MYTSVTLLQLLLLNYILLVKLQNQNLFHSSSLIIDRAYPSTIMHVNREGDWEMQTKNTYFPPLKRAGTGDTYCSVLGKSDDNLTSIVLHYT